MLAAFNAILIDNDELFVNIQRLMNCHIASSRTSTLFSNEKQIFIQGLMNT
jgi:hypothetical protein